MKITPLFSITLIFLLNASTSLASPFSENKITDEMTLNYSIKIWTGPNQSIVVIPKGKELPATETHTLLVSQNQSLTTYFFKEDGQELNENNLIGEFWFSQLEDSSEVKLEVVAETNHEIKIHATDIKTGKEKTMIFVDTQNGIDNLEQYLSEKNTLLKSSGGVVNYVIYQLSSGYLVQLASGKDEELVRCEASISNGGPNGNFELTTLPQEKLNQLEKLGWSAPDFGELNYFYWGNASPENSLDHITQNFIETINAVYDGSTIVHTTINLE